MRRHATAAEPLPLIPIMNLVTLLIPFLLMSAQFVAYAIIESKAPPVCGADCGEDEVESLSVRVRIDRAGFRLQATGAGDPALADGLDLPCPGPCEGPDSYDVDGLRDRLLALKQAHPHASSVVLVPSPDLPYEALVLAMDATREDPRQGSLPGEGCAGRCLFPLVTVAGGG